MDASRLWRFGQDGAGIAGPPWDWLTDAAASFRARLLAADPYPCHFGVRGQRDGHNSMTAMDSRIPDEYGVPGLGATLQAFAHRAAQGPPRQSLIVFCGPPDLGPDRQVADLPEHRRRFWCLLGELASGDPTPWPAEVPTDVTQPRWQWCFGGQPWFVFGLSPAYVARRSRSVGTCLTLVFQTARVFQGLGGSTPAGRRAKRRIRQRLVEYDGVPPHPHLGHVDRSSTYKWRQYVLPDDDRIYQPDQCPMTPAPRYGPGG